MYGTYAASQKEVHTSGQQRSRRREPATSSARSSGNGDEICKHEKWRRCWEDETADPKDPTRSGPNEVTTADKQILGHQRSWGEQKSRLANRATQTPENIDSCRRDTHSCKGRAVYPAALGDPSASRVQLFAVDRAVYTKSLG